jgi:disease resistance protein
MDSLKICTRQGCRQKYTDKDNNDTVCKYHDGKPLFHDIKKGWTCCNVIVYDWEEFMKIPGCKIGSHTDEKSQDTQFFKSNTVSNAEKGLNKLNETTDTPVVKDIKEYEEEQRRIEEAKKKLEMEKPKEILKASDGKYFCGNAGCSNKTYEPEINNEGDCKHHLGQPVFHDRKKFWNCCKQEAYDWDDFMKLAPCAVGKHVPKYKN